MQPTNNQAPRSWRACWLRLCALALGLALYAQAQAQRTEAASEPKPPGFQPDTNRWAWIPPGTFTMGSPASEQGRQDNEGPQTRVTITRGFWMRRYEVTQGEIQAVMGGNPSWIRGKPNLPVESVSWSGATSYCARLTAAERAAGRLPAGWEYRLPTEAEWEYACRAGTTNRFSFGDHPSYIEVGKYAWYVLNSGGEKGTTHAVGQNRPNPWGLYDMHGNVQEWCSDWYGTYGGGSVSDPKGPGSGSHRVLRGGSWICPPGFCRSAYRMDRLPDDRVGDLGFRVVLAPGQP